MLEKIDLSKEVDKKEAKKILKEQELKLSEIQRRLRDNKIPVIIIFEGMDEDVRGVMINKLIHALDPRGFNVYAIGKEKNGDKKYPLLWRFFNKIPPKGRISIFDRSWYKTIIDERFKNKSPDSQSERKILSIFRDISCFERQLTDDGTIIIKLFIYTGNESQQKKTNCICREMLEKTDYSFSPWTIIEAADKKYAQMKIFSTVINTLMDELIKREYENNQDSLLNTDTSQIEDDFDTDILSGVDLSKKINKTAYKKELKSLKNKIRNLHNELHLNKIPVVICFEGWDAAGKGGAIKRLTDSMDPRIYTVSPTSVPNDHEKMYHYLWRFWNHMPKDGNITIFDRTWYGRVLVERIEGFCTKEEWQRAYQEINEMEAHLIEHGTIILKFFIHIDKDEQAKRFEARMNTPEKRWKITDEDFRNREKWDSYEKAINEMIMRTGTTYAPWIIVEGNDKKYARIKILKAIVKAFENGLEKKQ